MLASIKGQQWMVRQDAVQAFALSALDVPEKANSLNISLEDFFEMRPPATIDGAGIAHIHVHAMLVSSAPPIYEKLGLVTRYATIIAETTDALAQGAKGIIFHVDSPGGTVSGNIEASNYIRDLEVPTIAFCSGLACSAAYKLASGCNAILASQSAQVGNIGTILSWGDCDKFWEEVGITWKALVSEGADLKSTFYLEPDPKQLAFLQESINDSGRQFREHVAAGRTAAGATLDPEVWRAGWYSGERAELLGLIDGIGSAEDAAEGMRLMIGG